MSMLETATLSVAVQVIVWLEPMNQSSPPFGLVTVTTGAWLSIGTVPGGPPAVGRSWLLQSRSLRSVMLTVPGPLGAELDTSIVNRVPLVPVAPHGVTASS